MLRLSSEWQRHNPCLIPAAALCWTKSPEFACNFQQLLQQEHAAATSFKSPPCPHFIVIQFGFFFYAETHGPSPLLGCEACSASSWCSPSTNWALPCTSNNPQGSAWGALEPRKLSSGSVQFNSWSVLAADNKRHPMLRWFTPHWKHSSPTHKATSCEANLQNELFQHFRSVQTHSLLLLAYIGIQTLNHPCNKSIIKFCQWLRTPASLW